MGVSSTSGWGSPRVSPASASVRPLERSFLMRVRRVVLTPPARPRLPSSPRSTAVSYLKTRPVLGKCPDPYHFPGPQGQRWIWVKGGLAHMPRPPADHCKGCPLCLEHPYPLLSSSLHSSVSLRSQHRPLLQVLSRSVG